MKMNDETIDYRMMLRWLLLALSLLELGRNFAADAAISVGHDCTGSKSSYISGSVFEANLNYTLFSVLPANATVSGFNNFTMSHQTTNDDDSKVYALYLCRGDLKSPAACHDCVAAAAKEIVQLCPFNNEAIVWCEQCMLRYSNISIFSREEDLPSFLYYNYSSNEISSYFLDPYQQNFNTMMQELINQAANNGFATKEVVLSSPTNVLRGMMQCTPDILGSGCDHCLRAALKQMNLRSNTIVFLASCNVRFDVYGSQNLPPIPHARHKHKLILIVVVLSAIGFVVLLVGFLFWRIRRNAGAHEVENLIQNGQQESGNSDGHDIRPRDQMVLQTDVPEPNERGKQAGFKRFSFLEVEKMTNGFQIKIGEGGFGSLYSGCLMDGSTEVAVKVLSNDGPSQFSTEIEVFGKISHKNLVSLIGYCEDGTNLALIYEYMARGDLQGLLKGTEPLSWKKRLEVAIDSAQGLDYLHNGCKPPIVHRDVKSPNILLNQDYGAKIADFGFSKIFPEEYVSGLATRIIGSPGYLDPQYYSTSQLNEKSDVYSFGVVLLELITGKSAIVNGNITLTQWVKPMLDRGDMDSIADPRLPQQDQTRASVWRATDLAMECVKFEAVERPTMSAIVTELKECLAMEIDTTARNARLTPNSLELMNRAASMSPTAR